MLHLLIKFRFVFLFVLVMLLSLEVEVKANVPGAGRSALPYMSIPPGGRFTAMGEAGVALADDAFGPYYNTAGLGLYPLSDNWVRHNFENKEVNIKSMVFPFSGNNNLAYIVTDNGLFRWDGRNFQDFEVMSIVGEQTVEDIIDLWIADESNNIIFRSNILRFNNLLEDAENLDVWSLRLPYRYITGDGIRDIEADKKGRLYIVSDSSITYFNGARWEKLTWPNDITGEIINVKSNDNDLWVQTTRGFYIKRDNSTHLNLIPIRDLVRISASIRTFEIHNDSLMYAFVEDKGLMVYNIDKILREFDDDRFAKQSVLLKGVTEEEIDSSWREFFEFTHANVRVINHLQKESAQPDTIFYADTIKQKSLILAPKRFSDELRNLMSADKVDSVSYVETVFASREEDSLYAVCNDDLCFVNKLFDSLFTRVILIDEMSFAASNFVEVKVFEKYSENPQEPYSSFLLYAQGDDFLKQLWSVMQEVVLKGVSFNLSDTYKIEEKIRSFDYAVADVSELRNIAEKHAELRVIAEPLDFSEVFYENSINDIFSADSVIYFAGEGGVYFFYPERMQWKRFKFENENMVRISGVDRGGIIVQSENRLYSYNARRNEWTILKEKLQIAGSLVSGRMVSTYGSSGVEVLAPSRKRLGLNYHPLLPELNFDDLYLIYGSFIYPDFPIGTLGLQFTYVSYGEQVHTSEVGRVEGTFRSFDWNVGLSWGMNIIRGHSIGLGFKGIYSRLAPASVAVGNQRSAPAVSWMMDFGYIHRGSIVSFGASLVNLGPRIFYVDRNQADPPPTTIKVGTAVKVPSSSPFNMTIVFDIDRDINIIANYTEEVVNVEGTGPTRVRRYFHGRERIENEFRALMPHGGVEINYADIISFRGGYVHDRVGSRQYIPVGAGLQIYNLIDVFSEFRLDVAYIIGVDDFIGKNTYKVSMEFVF